MNLENVEFLKYRFPMTYYQDTIKTQFFFISITSNNLQIEKIWHCSAFFVSDHILIILPSVKENFGMRIVYDYRCKP